MSRPEGEGLTDAERYDQGMVVRREVLSDAHVDRAIAGTTELTADFQDFITRVAWGDIWSRPGLDRRSRSVAVLTALIALGHHEELAMHLRAVHVGESIARDREHPLAAGARALVRHSFGVVTGAGA